MRPAQDPASCASCEARWHIPLVPTGGITADTASAFMAAGAAALACGGWLIADGVPMPSGPRSGPAGDEQTRANEPRLTHRPAYPAARVQRSPGSAVMIA